MKTQIIEKLNKSKVRAELDGFRIIDPIKVGNYKLSIQGGEGHYCSPREKLNFKEYESVEVAFFNKNAKDFLNIKRSNVFKSFPKYKELLSYSDTATSPKVYGYVPLELIAELYNFLNK